MRIVLTLGVESAFWTAFLFSHPFRTCGSPSSLHSMERESERSEQG